jgi:LPXTG-motif cell wall-anchored protein
MNKNVLGILVMIIGFIWTVACIFADTLGLGPAIFNFNPNTGLGRIQLVFIFIGVLIMLIGLAVVILIKGEEKVR